MAPIAGNLRVERDLLAMDQLQIGFRGGNIFGQVVVDYEDGAPKVSFKGNVTAFARVRGRCFGRQCDLESGANHVEADGRIGWFDREATPPRHDRCHRPEDEHESSENGPGSRVSEVHENANAAWL